MIEKTFPKLNYPLDTRTLTKEQELILLAYDLIWRKEFTTPTGQIAEDTMTNDTMANLSNLGYYIEHKILNGIERFELDKIFGEEVFDASQG